MNKKAHKKSRDECYWRSWSLSLPTGCRTGVRWSCSIAYTVFLINCAVFIWTLSTYQIEQGAGTLFRGNCKKAKNLNAVVQVGINLLSTLLLGASNYSMQYLGAPTRKEVDHAHANKKMLCIGVPALKNLKNISRC